MTSRLFNEIVFIRGDTYIFYAEEGKLDISPNTEDYFQWLDSLNSFHFKGKTEHFTARKEQKRTGEYYWYAYRKSNRKQIKKYVGATDRLTLQHLEAIATVIQEEIHNQPPLEKKPRKKLDSKELKSTLRAKISFLETTVEQQKKRIQELEKELNDVKIQKATEGHRQTLKNWYEK